MNRFGDDLVEDVLEFLPFEDKVKYRCVCQQWNRCLYDRQNILVIDGSDSGLDNPSFHSLNKLVVKTEAEDKGDDDITNRASVLRKESFESVLKICKNIRKLVITGCECNNEVLRIISDNCPLLEDIECELICINPTENCLLEFGQKLGKRLKRLRFVYFIIDFEIMKSFLKCCPNLLTINCDMLEAVVDQSPDFLPKLRSLRVRVRPNDEKNFEILAEKYGTTVKSLQCLTLYGSSQCFPGALRHVSNLTSLQELTLDLNCEISTGFLVPNIILIAERVENLKKLVINSLVFISGEFFRCLGRFRRLTELRVNQILLHTKSNANVNISHLSGCQSLRHLSINGFNFDELFFEDISLYLPKLKSIEFSLMADNVITDRLFRSFESLEELQKFSFALIVNKSKKLNVSSLQILISQLVMITDEGLSHLISTSPKLRLIELKNVFTDFVGEKTLNSIRIKAQNNRKVGFILNIIGEKSGIQSLEKSVIELGQIIDNLSINLN